MTDPDFLTCSAWGPMKPEQYRHLDCPVVIVDPSQGIDGSPARTGLLPMVCPCECQVCERAWWDAGRPILKNGQILTQNSRRTR